MYHAEFKRMQGDDIVLSIQKDDVEVAEKHVPKAVWEKKHLAASIDNQVGFLVSQCNQWVEANDFPALLAGLKGEVRVPQKALDIASSLGISEAGAKVIYQSLSMADMETFLTAVSDGTLTLAQLGY